MEEQKNQRRGGKREGAGRKDSGRNVQLLVRITQEAKDKLDTVKNKSEWIDMMIKKNIK